MGKRDACGRLRIFQSQDPDMGKQKTKPKQSDCEKKHGKRQRV